MNQVCLACIKRTNLSGLIDLECQQSFACGLGRRGMFHRRRAGDGLRLAGAAPQPAVWEGQFIGAGCALPAWESVFA